jgi:hypothetical protein
MYMFARHSDSSSHYFLLPFTSVSFFLPSAARSSILSQINETVISDHVLNFKTTGSTPTLESSYSDWGISWFSLTPSRQGERDEHLSYLNVPYTYSSALDMTLPFDVT